MGSWFFGKWVHLLPRIAGFLNKAIFPFTQYLSLSIGILSDELQNQSSVTWRDPSRPRTTEASRPTHTKAHSHDISECCGQGGIPHASRAENNFHRKDWESEWLATSEHQHCMWDDSGAQPSKFWRKMIFTYKSSQTIIKVHRQF